MLKLKLKCISYLNVLNLKKQDPSVLIRNYSAGVQGRQKTTINFGPCHIILALEYMINKFSIDLKFHRMQRVNRARNEVLN